MEHPLPEPSGESHPEAELELLPALDDVDSAAAQEEEEEPDNAVLTDVERLQTSDPLKLYVRQIGDGRLLTVTEERELARRKAMGDEGGEGGPRARTPPPPRGVHAHDK